MYVFSVMNFLCVCVCVYMLYDVRSSALCGILYIFLGAIYTVCKQCEYYTIILVYHVNPILFCVLAGVGGDLGW